MHDPTLEQFLQDHPYRGNSYVSEPGFDHLYVRVGPRYVDGVKYPKVLDIANAQVTHKGCGTFTNLILRLHRQGYILYVESVLNVRLGPKLVSLGFTELPTNGPPNYYLLPPKV